MYSCRGSGQAGKRARLPVPGRLGLTFSQMSAMHQLCHHQVDLKVAHALEGCSYQLPALQPVQGEMTALQAPGKTGLSPMPFH